MNKTERDKFCETCDYDDAKGDSQVHRYDPTIRIQADIAYQLTECVAQLKQIADQVIKVDREEFDRKAAALGEQYPGGLTPTPPCACEPLESALADVGDICPGCEADFDDDMTDEQAAILEADVCPYCEFKLQ